MVKLQRPFLKWAGGKYNLLKHILPVLPQGTRLVEPFVGAGSVFLNTTYQNYLLAEKNNDLINLYHAIQKEGAEFIQYCKKFFIPGNNNKECYNHMRLQFNFTNDIRIKSALFLYLNRFGYNGLCRYNSNGLFNVPFGKYNDPIFFPLQAMENFYIKSQKCEFVHNDFQEIFGKINSGDIVYCDPPYAPRLQSTNFTTYTPRKFSEEDQIVLAELAKQTSKNGIPVIISNHDTQFTRKIYKGAKIISFPVRRLISQNANNRIAVNELLAIFM